MTNEQGNLAINSENIFPIIKKWLYSDHFLIIGKILSLLIERFPCFAPMVIHTPFLTGTQPPAFFKWLFRSLHFLFERPKTLSLTLILIPNFPNVKKKISTHFK